MEELILKMHEEALELQEAVTALRGVMDELRDLIVAEECKCARNSFMNRENVEDAELKCRDIRRALGDFPGICKEAETILKEREDAKRKATSADDEGCPAE